MPWSGKSVVGRRVAEQLGCRFTDTDSLIRDRLRSTVAEKELHEAFASLAKDRPTIFRMIEDDVVMGLHRHRGLVATGGSAVYGERAMRRLAKVAVIVHLQVSPEILAARALETGDAFSRGIVYPVSEIASSGSATETSSGMIGDDAVIRAVCALHDERASLYDAAAERRVVADDLDACVEAVAALAAALWSA